MSKPKGAAQPPASPAPTPSETAAAPRLPRKGGSYVVKGDTLDRVAHTKPASAGEAEPTVSATDQSEEG